MSRVTEVRIYRFVQRRITSNFRKAEKLTPFISEGQISAEKASSQILEIRFRSLNLIFGQFIFSDQSLASTNLPFKRLLLRALDLTMRFSQRK